MRHAGYTPEKTPKITARPSPYSSTRVLMTSVGVREWAVFVQQPQEPGRDQDADDRTGQREHDVLEDELRHECARRRSECLTHADLRRPFHDPADIEVHEVDRWQEHEKERQSRQRDHQLPPLRIRILAIGPRHLTGERIKTILEWRDDRRVRPSGPVVPPGSAANGTRRRSP